MTDNEINVAIAEACGISGPWKEKITPCGCDGQWDFFNQNGNRLPDYCHDLNAMHDAEETGGIEPYETHAYVLRLYQVLKRDWDIAGKDTVDFDRQSWEYAYCHASARQRAEAFLRTLGKWRD